MTSAVDVVTVLLSASAMRTTGWVGRTEPEIPATGAVVTNTFAAAPNTVIVFVVASVLVYSAFVAVTLNEYVEPTVSPLNVQLVDDVTHVAPPGLIVVV